ncbi:glycosyltransferase [Fulvivirga sp. M361]|uniref:glycosyltransferase family 2 protein n=1 Tax=Fulvivirga sp. M361 TaxID=2594266 RepID=UPI00117AC289|nr:glycosyltransferase family 2 protein [Fulvivirga sp. M361]TRX55608.1 glycosyltransferase [Fulvivirga sp. M361]
MELKNYPKISIVTPSLNQGQFLEQTILSVLDQKYPNLEYIIIDGGSSDGSKEIIKKYSDRITYWVSEKDSGQSDAINKGLNKATGEIFNWINSDDYYEPGALFEVAHAFEKSDTNVVCGYNRLVDESGKRIGQNRLYLKDEIEKSLFFTSFRQAPTFFKTDRIQKLGGVREDYHFNMDYELFIRYLLRYGQTKFKFIDKTLVNFRHHETSKTIQKQDSFTRERSEIFENLISDKYELDQNDRINSDKALAYYYAFKALKTSRMKIGQYLTFLFSGISKYPSKGLGNYLYFLIKEIVFYK